MDLKTALFVQLHDIIKDYSEIGKQLTNPKEDSVLEQLNLSQKELSALQTMEFTPEAIGAIEKIVRDNIMGAFFDVFCLADGVVDPDSSLLEPNKIWYGLKITEKQLEDDDDEAELMLHDKLYDSYWDWEDVQKEKKK